MQRKAIRDWRLLWLVAKNQTGFFVTVLICGLGFGLGGGFFVLVGYGDLLPMVIGGFFALVGVALFVGAFVMTWSSMGYYYGQALLRKYGIQVDGVLTKKEAQCQFHQVHDHQGRPRGEGYYLCDLYLEFEFQFNGSNHSGAYFINKAALFDKLRMGDRMPLMVLRYDPSVHQVRERRLSNLLKGREPEVPSQIPEGAEIGQSVG